MLETGNVIGLPVTAGTFDEVAGEIIRLAGDHEKGVVCVANAHMLTTARRDPELAEILNNATIVTSDGMPLVWALRRQGLRQAERVAGPDLVVRLCELASERSLPVYFYGGTDDTLPALREAITRAFPDLPVAGLEAPPRLPLRPATDERVGTRIASKGPRIVFVGLGCPKQEFWMANHLDQVNALTIGVGAAFDFLAGQTRRAPVWMQRFGLEWLFRFLSEPRRLWKRYLVTNSLFVLDVLRYR